MIEIKQLQQYYTVGEKPIYAVREISLSIEKGEFVAIIGPSGSGKSTLLHLLGGLQRPSSGSIMVSEKAIENLNDHQRAHYRNHQVGFIFQNFYLQKHLTAIENVVLPLKIRGNKTQNRRSYAEKLLSDMGLADRLHHLPGELSGGERQRVAIARALVTEPSILLADEPTGNLDRKTSEEIMRILIDCHQSGSTIVLVTHNTKIAKQASRIIHLEDGLVIREERNDGNASS